MLKEVIVAKKVRTPEDVEQQLAKYQRKLTGILQLLPPVIVVLGDLFAAAGHELALVGGPVRDALLNVASADLDFTTSASPDETSKILKKWGDACWDIGKEFGTIGAKKTADVATGEVSVEVTTFRTDKYDPESRKPIVAYGDSLEADLSRRDFTVNSMAIRLPVPEFVDPFNGLADLAAEVLRTPIAPEKSFDDDPLRMMRAARFTAQLGFEIEAETAAAITALKERIKIVSAERVRDEIVKLLKSSDPVRGIESLVDSGLAELVLPEVPGMKLAIDANHHHKEVYSHSLTVLQQAIDLETDSAGAVPRPDLVLRLAALLHDIGKPATRKFEAGGVVTFRNHEVVGAKMAAKRMRALRFDNDLIDQVKKLVFLHLRFHGYGEQQWTDSAVRRYVVDAGDQLERLHRLTRADVTTQNKRKANRLARAYDELEARIAELAEQEELNSIRPELNGEQIMAILNVKPGPVVGEAYRFLLELRLDEGILGEDAATAALKDWWQARQG